MNFLTIYNGKIDRKELAKKNRGLYSEQTRYIIAFINEKNIAKSLAKYKFSIDER